MENSARTSSAPLTGTVIFKKRASSLIVGTTGQAGQTKANSSKTSKTTRGICVPSLPFIKERLHSKTGLLRVKAYTSRGVAKGVKFPCESPAVKRFSPADNAIAPDIDV